MAQRKGENICNSNHCSNTGLFSEKFPMKIESITNNQMLSTNTLVSTRSAASLAYFLWGSLFGFYFWKVGRTLRSNRRDVISQLNAWIKNMQAECFASNLIFRKENIDVKISKSRILNGPLNVKIGYLT